MADPPVSPVSPAPAHRRRSALLLALPLVGAAVGLSALTTGSPVAPAPTVAPAVPRSAEDVGFLRTVRQQVAFSLISDDSLVKIGHMLCGQLRGGTNPDDIAMGNSTVPLSVEDVSTAVGAAAGAYCPDQIDRVGTTG